MKPEIQQSKPHVKFIIYFYACFAWMCATLTMPLTSALSHQLKTTSHTLQVTVSLLLLCFAISQFIGGTLSDVFGRKKVVLSFLSLSFIGLLISALSTNASMFIIGQIIAGLGSGVLAVLTRAIAVDHYQGKTLGKIFTTNAMLIFISPVLSSLIGMLFFSSQQVTNVYFIFLAVSAVLIIISAIFLPETLHQTKRAEAKLSAALIGYLYAIKNTQFLCYWFIFGIAIALVIGGVFSRP